MKNGKREDKLLGYANSQAGYFTAKQAEKAGYSYRLHSYHTSTGRWIKVDRGVFRLRSFPASQREDLIRWTLWSRNQKDKPQMVASHETALVIYELSDVMPAKLHFTVPSGFRKKVPKNLILHRSKLHEDDAEKREGFSVTTPLRTLVDVAEGNLSEDELAKALRDAIDKGFVQLKKIDVTKMSEKGKLRMLMAIRAVEEKKTKTELWGFRPSGPKGAEHLVSYLKRKGVHFFDSDDKIHNEKENLVNAEERGKELKAELERILEILRKQIHPEKVILFGSLASGKLRPESDIDLLIVQESNDSIFERKRKLESLLNRRYAADLIVLTPGEVRSLLDSDNRYIKQIFSRGKVLYDRAA